MAYKKFLNFYRYKGSALILSRILKETHLLFSNLRNPTASWLPAVKCSESTFGYSMTKNSTASSLAHQTAKM